MNVIKPGLALLAYLAFRTIVVPCPLMGQLQRNTEHRFNNSLYEEMISKFAIGMFGSCIFHDAF